MDNLDTFRLVIAVLVAQGVWQAMKEVWKLYWNNKRKEGELRAGEPRERGRIAEGAAREMWKATAERRIQAMDSVWDAQKRLGRMLHVVVSGMLHWKDQPEARTVILEKMAAPEGGLPRLDEKYISEMLKAADVESQAQAYVGKEFWTAWKAYQAFVIGIHVGPVAERAGILREGCNAVWYDDREMMELLQAHLTKDELLKMWRGGFPNVNASWYLRERMVEAARREMDEEVYGTAILEQYERVVEGARETIAEKMTR